ncbi:MAG: class I SAM-dependent methyltransferase [Rhodospirillales bacterium]|nr:MAG: class I SAM-dependent methyltransferase [Rhodospirillales bacterium]
MGRVAVEGRERRRVPASVDQTIAASLGADPALLPVLDYLLQDVDVLGPDPQQIVGMLRPLRLSGAQTALDLGCGKGTVATALAVELGLHVTGIDAFAPFIDECRTRASAMGVGGACLFEAMDIRRLVGRLPRFDVVLLLAGGGVFGDDRETVSALRTFAEPGGFMVIGDLSGAAGPGVAPVELDRVVQALTAWGDHLVGERHGLSHEALAERAVAARRVARRARELMRLYPGLAATMWEFVDGFGGGSGGASAPQTSTVWLLRRAADAGLEQEDQLARHHA